MSQTTLSPAKPELRRAFGRFPTGIAVITTRDADGEPFGLTINSFTSVSMDPPMVSWNVIRGSRAHTAICGAQAFVVNILAATQQPIAQQMASPSSDRFVDIHYDVNAEDMPILAGTVATFECEVHALVTAGDHDIVLGVIKRFAHCDGMPLVYWQGTYATALVDASL